MFRSPPTRSPLLIGLFVVATSAFAHTEHPGADPVIEGTWLNTVRIVTCPPAPHAVIATFRTMTTYIRGGSLVEGGAPSPPPPAVSRSAGYGIWERVHDHRPHIRFDRQGNRLPPASGQIRALIHSHSFDNLGRLVRLTEVFTQPTLVRGDNPDTADAVEPYYLSGEGTNRITNYDPATGSVIGVTRGCNEAVSRPLTFDDIPQ